MKLRITFQTVITVALLALAGLAGASSGTPSPKLRPPGGIEQICRAQYLNCMFGSNSAWCGWNYQDCLRGGPGPILTLANNASPLRSEAELEQQTHALRSLIAANVRPQASTSMSWVYCRKMMDKCDRGDQLACELFDRYCGG